MKIINNSDITLSVVAQSEIRNAVAALGLEEVEARQTAGFSGEEVTFDILEADGNFLFSVNNSDGYIFNKA